MSTPAAHRPEDQNVGALELSVVVPAFNGERTIGDCLASIVRATQGHRAEIIVVDSSTDRTPDLVHERFPEVKLIHSAQRLSAGTARTRGATVARGQAVFFTDQDCLVPADWIDRLLLHFRDPEVHAAGGSVAIHNSSSASACALYFLEFLYHFPSGGPPQRDTGFLIGCNSAFRAEVIQAVGFPDQTLGEDVLLSYRLRSEGFHTLYDPRIEVLNRVREGWSAFFRYNRRMGRSAAAYHAVLGTPRVAPFLRHPSLVFLAPMVILPSVARSLLRSHAAYLLRFLLLAPICLLGNFAWACGFAAHARNPWGAAD